jgi:YggT family protein
VDVIIFIADTLLWLLLLAFVLRLLLQLVRANFRDPLADALVRVTNWLILPLRRVLPPAGKVDTATVVAVFAVAAVRTGALLALRGVYTVDWPSFLRVTAVGLADLVLRIYLFALLIYWLTSYVAAGADGPGMGLVTRLCEPVLRRFRRWIPPIGQIDFSVLWASIAIGALLILLSHA